MTFHSIIIKNIKSNIKNYISFLFSNSIILCILFMFFTLIFSPDFLSKESSSIIKENLNSMVIVMTAFSIAFIFFSVTSFTKFRGKEFGVYFTLGLTTKEIIKILSFENLITSVISFIFAIISGTLFSKLFHLFIGKILSIENISIKLSMDSYIAIAIISIVIYLATIFYQFLYLNKYSISDILKSKKNQNIEKVNKIVGVIGIIMSIGSIYILDIGLKGKATHFTEYISISALGLVISLYILIGYSVALVVSIMKVFRGFYNHNILFINSLSYRLKYFKTVLYVVTLMAIGAIGFISIDYSTYKNTEIEVDNKYPYEIGMIIDQNEFDESKIKSLESKYSDNIKSINTVEGINIPVKRVENGECTWNGIQTVAISEESYNLITNSDVRLENNQVIYFGKGKVSSTSDLDLIVPIIDKDMYSKTSLEKFKKEHNSDEYLYVTKENKINKNGVVFNYFRNKDYDRFYTLVVNNEIYEIMKEKLGSDKLSYDLLINLRDNTQSKELIDELKYDFGQKAEESLTIKEKLLEEARKENGFSLFIYSFMGLIFLMGSSAILYFKTMTNINEDKNRNEQLLKLGLTKDEINKLFMKEIGVVFIVPSIIALIITGGFLRKIYSLMENSEYMWKNSLFVFVVYLLIQFLFYIVTANKYKKLVG